MYFVVFPGHTLTVVLADDVIKLVIATTVPNSAGATAYIKLCSETKIRDMEMLLKSRENEHCKRSRVLIPKQH